MNQATYQFNRETIGRLNCGVVQPTDTEQPISIIGVFCHGYGASGDDLVGIASEILQIAPMEGAAMLVFPEAPLGLEEQGMPGGRAWWHLSIQRLISAIEDGQYELVREEVPEEIDDAREMLVESVTTLMDRVDLGFDRLLLGGFSQGSMLCVDAALRGESAK